MLYWKNTNEDGLWDTIGNWWNDAAATDPHLSLPASGDDCAYATEESTTVHINTETVNLGVGSCTFTEAVVIDSGGEISGGTFACGVINGGLISGGTFEFAVMLQNSGTISGGTFTSTVIVVGAGVITGGTFGANFTGKVYFTNTIDSNWNTSGNWFCNTDGNRTAGFSAVPAANASSIEIDLGSSVSTGPSNCTAPVTNNGTINEGVFSGAITNVNNIFGGTFSADGFVNAGSIYGGVFTGDGFNNSSIIYCGTFTNNAFANNGSIYGGIFVNASFDHQGGISGGTFSASSFIGQTTGIQGGFWWLQGWMKVSGVLVKSSGSPVPGGGTPLFTQTLITQDLLGGGLL